MSNVSVIIPTFNRCQTLRRALQSVIGQSVRADEIIVVDDGSTDHTRSMVMTEFPMVRYYHQNNNGVSAARNYGISRAEGEWLAFLDSDDEWLPKKLESQLDLLAKKPESLVCHTEEIWIRNGIRVNAMRKHRKRGGWIFQHCLPLCAMSPSSIMLHRSVLDRTGHFDTRLPACEDYDLWLRITAFYPVLFIEQAQIIKYGGHEDQLSSRFWGMDRFRIIALIKILETDCLSGPDRQAAKKMLLRKINIYLKGAVKRNKQDEVDHYRQLIEYYSAGRNKNAE